MSRLNTKLTREFLRARWQFLALTATVALGIGFFQGALVSYGNLGHSYDLTYRRLAFGDVWVRMDAAPDTLIRRAERIPGVRTAVGRIVEEVRVALRDRPVREVMGRIISLPADRRPEVNRVNIVEGRHLSPQGRREALLEVSFARAHDYDVGEFIYPTIRGEEVRFRIVGLVQSPEYIYAIQSKQYLIPTPNTFGVMFIPERQAELLFDMGGLINELCLTTDPGVRNKVAARVEHITDPYGGEEPVTRDEQPSYKLLKMDLDGYRQMAVIFPLLFLTAAVLTTYTLLARLVQAQSPQIGVLRATGFTQRAVLMHFLWLSLLPAIAGSLIGIGLGYAFAWFVTDLYVTLINIPFMSFQLRPEVVVGALLIAAASGLIGGISPARAAARMPPAVAMSQQAMLAQHLPRGVRWLGAGLPLPIKLPLRNLVRRPRRALYTTLGLALGICLLILSFGMLDAVDHAVTTFFEEIERYDLSAGFVPEQPGRLVTHIQSWPGVRRAEPTLDIAVELKRNGVTHSTVLSGVPPDARLRRLTTDSGRRAVPRAGEVLLGSMLRDKLGVAEGDLVGLHYAQNRRDFKIIRTARVGPPITQPIGSTAYMRMEDVQRLFADRLGYPLSASNGVLIEADPDRMQWVKERLHRLPTVATVQSRAQTHEQIEELMGFTKAFTGILALFGIGLAFAVVFTAVSVNVLERRREIATLRTLGFGMPAITLFATVENFALAGLGAIIGLPLGRWLDSYLMTSAQSESMSLDPIIYGRTYLIALGGMALLTLLAQFPSLRHIRRMDLAATTKELAT